MSRLIILLGLLCSLRSSFATLPTTTPLTGINYEYNPPEPKSDTDLFVALLEPTSGENVTVAQFMYHLKHGIYAAGFKSEIFTLGIHIHLFIDEEMSYPSVEDRRIAITVGKLWPTLTGMRALNRITLQIGNETAHRYLKAVDRIDTFSYLFSKLQDVVLANPTFSKTYSDEKQKVDLMVLPQLQFININLTKFGSVDRTLKKSVWTDPKSFSLVAHERFSQHLETDVENASTNDYLNVLLAHQLEQLASQPEFKESAQRAYDEGIKDAVSKSEELLKSKNYVEFDNVLFASLRGAIKTHSKLRAKLALMLKTNYRTAPLPAKG